MEALISNRYKIIAALGRGGMGSAYKAFDRDQNLIVALKVMLPKHLANPKDVLRFQQEAATAGRLHHPGIAQVLDSGVSNEGRPYLVMEFIEGETLADCLTAKGQLPLEVTIEIFIQLCDALAYAHAKGVLHRDIKPSNIMISSAQGQSHSVKLLDFGIAKVMTGQGQTAQQITQPGELLGSPPYMSPEQAKGANLDVPSDLYSVGCTLYESLTGGPPHLGQSAVATLLKRAMEKPITLSEASMGGRFPPDLEAIVSKLLAADPCGRYQSAQELKDELLRVRAGQVIEPTQANNSQPPQAPVQRAITHERKYLWVGALLVVGFVSLGFLFWKQRTSTSSIYPAPESVAPRTLVLPEFHDSDSSNELELAETLIFKRDYEQADSVIKKIYASDSKKSIAERERDAMQLCDLGNIHQAQGQHTASQAYYNRALALLTPIAPVSLNMVKIKTGIATSYAIFNNFEQAELFGSEAAAIKEKLLGAQSGEYAYSLQHLGDMLILMVEPDDRRNWKKVAPYYDRAISICEKSFGKDDVRLAALLTDQGSACISHHLLPEAQTRLERAIEIYKLNQPRSSIDAAMAMLKLANVYDLEKNYSRAESLDQTAMPILRSNPKVSDAVLARGDFYMGDHYALMASPKEKALYLTAEKFYRRAVNGFEKQPGSSDPDLTLTLVSMADNCCRSVPSFGRQRLNDAEQLYKRALKICQRSPESYRHRIANIKRQLSKIERVRR